ncbi:entericidin A/B family lipoprotein [Thiohalobacter thiocyanaticus]|uniref:Entericidin, EcnA/B family n=1 Tax=Thiohalobacter thiocyanaticus TaxID=585455 RepID=A0A426QMN0_9GAMM|nr:entericidin A/B family lipoprotein [Thiohalobacter thiocyanaticus]RRQ23010.1 entericidin, EcnA/B family [Thiohalobacter thiocyanaticus]
MKTLAKNPVHPFHQFLCIGVLAAFGLSGCNTMAGIGQDVESAGESIEEEAVEEQRD